MQHLINITAGNPKTVEQYQLTKEFGAVRLFTEDGKNWCERQKYFADDTIKTACDEDNIIHYVEKDITAIRPGGLSVVEVPDITTNRRADVSEDWMLKGGVVTKRIYTAKELQQQAEIRRARLLADAESVTLPLERVIRLNTATEKGRSRLETWGRYSVLASCVDLANPEWPEVPQQIV